MGDQFFIILKGTVGILIPEAFNEVIGTYFELYTFVMDNHSYIHKFNDQHSRVVKTFIDIFGTNILKRIALTKPTEMIEFIEKILAYDAELLAKINMKNTDKID